MYTSLRRYFMMMVLCRDGTSSLDDVLIMMVLHIDGIHNDGRTTWWYFIVTVLHIMVLHFLVLHHCVMWYFILRYFILRYFILRYFILRYFILRYFILWYFILWYFSIVVLHHCGTSLWWYFAFRMLHFWWHLFMAVLIISVFYTLSSWYFSITVLHNFTKRW